MAATALSASLREPSARLALAQVLSFSAVSGLPEALARLGMKRVRALLSTLASTASRWAVAKSKAMSGWREATFEIMPAELVSPGSAVRARSRALRARVSSSAEASRL